jgi:hypothetical protein
MPADAFANPGATVASVACAGAGSCVAVGAYSLQPPGQEQGFIVTESNGTWGPARRPRLPLNAASVTDAGLFGVTCTGRRSCVAVGFYRNSAGQVEPMAVTESRGRWGRAVRIALPPDAIANQASEFNSVSCAGRSCTAVGVYQAGQFQFNAMAATESSGRWGRATRVRVPRNAILGGISSLTGVSCTAARSCVAVGDYRDGINSSEGMAATESRGRWARATQIALPSNARAGSPDAELTSVACIRAGFCAAAGSYINAGSDTQAVRVIEAGGQWRRARQIRPPANAATGSNVGSFADGLSCVPGQTCLAVGFYFVTSSNREAMAATVPLP